ncbi:MAG TPA: protein translocase subunit SecDF [Desulfofustis sp.]|jgi:SecD/SecF fusion protein|nr:protein translocase subunit SecD [Desulfofustis sp. PB-SRB1]HBH27401.1 protein translocase subunit SecDF [Desulfofustis sp.]
MNTTIKLKLGLLFFLVTLAVITVVPSFYGGTPTWWKKYMAPEGLRLGLDLQGGIHLVLRVNLPKALENTLELAANDLKDTLAKESISAVITESSTKDILILTLPNAQAIDRVQEIINDRFDEELAVTADVQEGRFPRLLLSLSEERVNFIANNAVNQSLEILRNRIDQFGVAEPVIVRQGEDEIVIQLPGVKDPDRAFNLLQGTAQLEFKLVAEQAGINLEELLEQAQSTGQWSGSRQEPDEVTRLNRYLAPSLPDNTSIYFERTRDRQTGLDFYAPILLENKVLMTGDMVKDAQVRVGGTFNEPYVSIDFTSRGGTLFADITEKNVGRQLAIVLDGNVRSAPRINERILGGAAQITGRFNHEEAADLAIVLRVGALPAPVDVIQNMTVGSTLGQDSIQKGITSGIFGAILVLSFMLVYYRIPGLIANFALALNMLFLFSGLAIMNATLTLPGIAGIVLSIGMAVDANVLIFERMREELAVGKSVRSSIDGGFSKALWTIVDSQVTTLITAMVLFIFGTGPIKGFAITLTLGIIFNLFTALFCSRLAFDTLTGAHLIKKLRFLRFTGKTSIDFMRLTKISFTISGVLVAVGLVALVQVSRGQANMGVDFSGGSLLQYRAEQPFSIAEVRDAFARSDLLGADLQEVENENRLMIKIRKSEAVVANLDDQVNAIFADTLADKGFVLESQSEIGASVSATLRNKAIQAIAISLVGVLIYLAFRFDLGFGLAAAAATFHDVLVVLGICYLFKVEITLLIVTALLTLAGYSLNDSVVVFDRIRENMKKSQTYLLSANLINDSINQVVSRTIVTSLTSAMVLLALFLFGGSVIHDFSFALLMGVLVGTYSSIFIASPLLTFYKRKPAK